MSPPSDSKDWVVPLSALDFSEAEVREVVETLRSGWWTYGAVSRKLEREFSDFLGVRHAVAVSSGTAALHLAVLALGLEADKSVLTPSFNFVASANTILHAGGYPEFVDVESLDSPLVTVSNLAPKFTRRTRGICVMHYGGYPCAMDAIMDFARSKGLWVIEDAAHAPGTAFRGIRCGAWGDIGCFSFFGNKNITCAEGGFAVTQRDDLAEKLRALCSHGMSSLTWDRFKGHQFTYDVSLAGFNYRIDDLRSSLLRVQLQSLERINRLRRERLAWYRQFLGDDAGWIVPFKTCESETSGHLMVVVLAPAIDRTRVMVRLKENGIQSSIHYPPVHRFSFYRKFSENSADLEVTEALGRRLVTLPLYPGMTEGQVRLVCDVFRKAVLEQGTSSSSGQPATKR